MNAQNWYCMYGEPFGIGATGHGLYLEDKLIVVDWGVGFGRTDQDKNLRYAPKGDYLSGEYVDLFVITHKHADHMGAAPRFVREHPEAMVVMSQKTWEASRLIFRDQLRRMESDFEEFDEEMFFTEEDVRNFYHNPNLIVIDEDGWSQKDDPWPGWQIGFHRSGHDVGAISFFLITPGNRRILFTGDICSQDQRVVKGVMLPSEEILGDFLRRGELTLITEGTNAGRRKIEDRDVIERRFVETVKNVASRNGVILIPCFGVNRSAETTRILAAHGLRPHVDGLGRRLSIIESPGIRDLIDEGKVIFFEDYPYHKKARIHRNLIGKGEDPCDRGYVIIDDTYFEKDPHIIVSPSATLEGGHSVTHAINILPDKNNAVIFVGHIFENTAAKQIRDMKRGKTIKLKEMVRGEEKEVRVNVRCEVYYFDFTAHDYQDSLVERVNLMNKKKRLKNVIMHHCPNEESFESFKQEVSRYPDPPNVVYGTQMKVIPIN